MKLSKSFLFGLGACALMNTSVNAGFVACPTSATDLVCNKLNVGSGKVKTVCGDNNRNFEDVIIDAPSLYPGFKLEKANDNQTCEYSFNNGAQGFQMKKKGVECTVATLPQIGFNCP